MSIGRNKAPLLAVSVLACLAVVGLVFYSLLGHPEQTIYRIDSEEMWLDYADTLKAAVTIDELNAGLQGGREVSIIRPITAPPGWQPWTESVGRVRIVVLGDSFTYGQGVSTNETFPSVLQGLLQPNFPEGIMVINLGVSGFGTQNEYELYKYVGSRFNPDLVILALHPDDWDDFKVTHSKGTLLGKLRDGLSASEVSWMAGLGRRILRVEQERRRRSMGHMEGWFLLEAPLRNLIGLAPPGCFLLVHDFYYQTSPQRLERIEALQEEYGFTALSLSSFYAQHTADEVTLSNDDHPNAFAHAQVAALIAEYILNRSVRDECFSP